MKNIILFMILMSSSVFAYNTSFYINASSLPYRNEINITMNYTINNTYDVKYGRFLTGESSGVYNFATDTITTQVLIDEDIELLNYTTWVNISGTNYSSNISFNFFIIDDIIRPETDFVQIDINEFKYTVCDYLLPINYSQDIVVSGNVDQFVQVRYDSIFFRTDLNEFRIPSEGEKIINVKLLLENMSVGNYKREIEFNIDSDFDKAIFNIEIKDCVIPFPDYQEMVDVCSIVNKTEEDFLRCSQLQAEYYKSVYDSLLESKEKQVVNNTIKEYVNYTELVPVLPIDDEVTAKLLKEFPTMVNNWDKKITELVERNNKLQNENEQIRKEHEESLKELTKENSLSLQKQIDINREKEIELEELEKSTVGKSLIYWFIFFAFISIIGYGIYYIKENHFPI